MAALKRDVEHYPDEYQYERAARLHASTSGIGDALKRLGVSYKKTLKHPKADEAQRRAFRHKLAAYPAQGRWMVPLDESGFAHDMPRTHGYATVGKRCYGHHAWRAKGPTHVIAALVGQTLTAVTLFACTIDANVFHQWAKPCLLPTLPKACVVILDNATFHKRQDTQQLFKTAGHTLEYLPAYSPDLNPIEKKWAQKKSIRRNNQCSIDELFK